MPTNAGKSVSAHSGEFWGGPLDAVSGALGFPLERWVSLMLITMLIAAMGANRALLRRLLGGSAFALAFRRVVFASLDVSCTVAATLPPCKRCRPNGALLDELLLVTGLALLFETNLRAEPFEKALRYGISEWGWRLLRVFYTGGMARLVRVGQGEKENTCALIGKAKNHRVTYVQPLRRLL